MKIKTRFAPSPTGYLHIGGLRTALYNLYFARKHGGTFLLRIEDTDQTRLVEGAAEALIDTLKRVGVNIDEGPFLQSQRLPVYQEHAARLIEHGHAYRCFCSKERLGELRTMQEAIKQPTKYDRRCLELTKQQIEDRLMAKEPYVVRLRIPDGETTFTDEIRGSITIPNSEIDDQVLLKSDGFPTYHLAVVVDDHLMGITHIIRGEEWISSVPKHVILYNAFGFPMPVFAHLPLILNPDKSKLSKRQGDVAVEDYLRKGYLPEALVNYVSLLGFNPTGDREIYTMDELAQAFDLTKVNKSGAVFDVTKLNWMNASYLRTLPMDTIVERVRLFIDGAGEGLDPETLQKAIAVERSRATTLADFSALLAPYASVPAYDPDTLVWKKADRGDALKQLVDVRALIEHLDTAVLNDGVLIESSIKGYIESEHRQTGNVLWPLRVALSGSAQSASPFELLWVLGKEESMKRIQHAITCLGT